MLLGVSLAGLVLLMAWYGLRSGPLQAQGSGRAGEASLRVRLLCDLARAMEWPPTNEVLTIALLKYDDRDPERIRQILGNVPDARWRELWVTNYEDTIKPQVLEGLPGCGILALSQRVDTRLVNGYFQVVAERGFVTIGDGFTRFAGMINFSQDGKLTYDRRKIEAKGFRVPQAFFDSYASRGVPVFATTR